MSMPGDHSEHLSTGNICMQRSVTREAMNERKTKLLMRHTMSLSIVSLRTA